MLLVGLNFSVLLCLKMELVCRAKSLELETVPSLT